MYTKGSGCIQSHLISSGLHIALVRLCVGKVLSECIGLQVSYVLPIDIPFTSPAVGKDQRRVYIYYM